ncbi:MAG TPA: PDZ domain-containing protein [Drouetiella sp.]
MKSRQFSLNSKHCGAVLACSILLMNAYPSFADTTVDPTNQNLTAIAAQLAPEVPVQDDANGDEAKKQSAESSKPLQGGVHKTQRNGTSAFQGDTDGTTLQGRADGAALQGSADGAAWQGSADGTALQGSADGAALQGSADGTALQGKMDNTKLQGAASNSAYKLAADKLSKGFKLSADEYRALNAGCAGYESNRTFFQNIAVVTVVYKDSPAYLAGIRKGDKLLDVDADQDKEAVEDPTIPRWEVSCGQAGTQVHITLLRHNQPIDVTLTRYNIEDIAEAKYRHEWEQILSQLGNPTEGKYSGIGSDPLKNQPQEP